MAFLNLSVLRPTIESECSMKNDRFQSPILVVFGVVALALHARAEFEPNPSISETQKVAELNLLETRKEKIRTEYLSAEVGGLRDGQYTIEGGYSTILTWVGVRGRTNLIAYKPLPSQAFDPQLFDEDGKEIKKTWYGREFGETPKPDKKLVDGTFRKDPGEMWGQSRELRFGHGAGDSHLWDFNALKAFKITEPGEYRLQVTVRLFVKDTNGVFQPLILPPVSRQVKILESDL